MIPKIIHYCWFGRNPKPKLAQRCIASWRKICPEYDVLEWNEDNFDVSQNPYMEYCLKNKKYAFLSDLVRLYVIRDYGGIYFDTDVELKQKPDELLLYEAFYGFENSQYVATGLGFGAVANHPTTIAMIEQYNEKLLGYTKESITECSDTGRQTEFPMIVCPLLNTAALLPFGLVLNGKRQNVAGAEILPPDYLNPYDNATGVLNLTENTISIHWYSKSWMSSSRILRSKLMRPIHRIFGNNCFAFLKRK